MPNDLAIAADGRLYLSGQDWGEGDGGLWMCKSDGTPMMLEIGMCRTNGIALSPDDDILYLTEACGSPVVYSDGYQKIWKYNVESDGTVSGKTLFFDFATHSTPEANDDSDGMRCDKMGNLYVTRNGDWTCPKE